MNDDWYGSLFGNLGLGGALGSYSNSLAQQNAMNQYQLYAYQQQAAYQSMCTASSFSAITCAAFTGASLYDVRPYKPTTTDRSFLTDAPRTTREALRVRMSRLGHHDNWSKGETCKRHVVWRAGAWVDAAVGRLGPRSRGRRPTASP